LGCKFWLAFTFSFLVEKAERAYLNLSLLGLIEASSFHDFFMASPKKIGEVFL